MRDGQRSSLSSLHKRGFCCNSFSLTPQNGMIYTGYVSTFLHSLSPSILYLHLTSSKTLCFPLSICSWHFFYIMLQELLQEKGIIPHIVLAWHCCFYPLWFQQAANLLLQCHPSFCCSGLDALQQERLKKVQIFVFVWGTSVAGLTQGRQSQDYVCKQLKVCSSAKK